MRLKIHWGFGSSSVFFISPMCFELQGLLNDTNRMNDAKARLSTLNTKERSEQLIQFQVVSFLLLDFRFQVEDQSVGIQFKDDPIVNRDIEIYRKLLRIYWLIIVDII